MIIDRNELLRMAAAITDIVAELDIHDTERRNLEITRRDQMAAWATFEAKLKDEIAIRDRRIAELESELTATIEQADSWRSRALEAGG